MLPGLRVVTFSAHCSFILADERGLQNPRQGTALHQALPLRTQPRAQNSCREQGILQRV